MALVQVSKLPQNAQLVSMDLCWVGIGKQEVVWSTVSSANEWPSGAEYAPQLTRSGFVVVSDERRMDGYRTAAERENGQRMIHELQDKLAAAQNEATQWRYVVHRQQEQIQDLTAALQRAYTPAPTSAAPNPLHRALGARGVNVGVKTPF